MMNFRISREAQKDLEGIWLYTLEEWSFEQANRYINLILNEIEFLCLDPESGSDYGFVRKDYSKARVQSHFIFYKIIKSEKRIDIIRIQHQRRDIDNQL